MHLRQILHSDLGCASYLIADQGEAAVIDPKWEIGDYLEAAADAQAEIRHVLETHVHADHVSGRRRLTAITGATAHVPATSDGLRVRDGDAVRVAGLELVAMATPGHSAEHVSYLVRDQVAPGWLLSGDSLLVGEVGWPNRPARAPEALRRLLALDPAIEVWPAHLAGSLGASTSASAATSSTIVTLNRRGVAHPGPVGEVIDPDALAWFLRRGVRLLDIRDSGSFDAGHLAGSINLPPGTPALGARAGWGGGSEEPILLISASLETGREAIELMLAAGVWNLAAHSVADPPAWRAAGLSVVTGATMAPARVIPPLAA